MTKAERQYKDMIEHFPAPGGGGAHTTFFKAGVLGYKSKLSEHQIFTDVSGAVPEGTRHVTEEEIITGIQKGFSRAMYNDVGGGNAADSIPKVRVPLDAFERLVTAGRGATRQDIMGASPVNIKDNDLLENTTAVLDTLYAAEDTLFIGGAMDRGQPGKSIRKVSDWKKFFKKSKKIMAPHIIVNPLSGEEATLKANPNKMSYRCDNAIVNWKYMVVEFDEVSLEDQLAFWAVVKLPVAALVYSGSKSIHGWVCVDCEDRNEWEREVEQDLFPGYLMPLGVDGSCRNESRLSRMPGHTREGSDKVQSLLYLAPGGRAVAE